MGDPASMLATVLFPPVGLGMLAKDAMGSSMLKPPAPPDVPAPGKAPTAEEAKASATARLDEKRRASTQSIYTSPQGILSPAPTSKKTLLGN